MPAKNQDKAADHRADATLEAQLRRERDLAQKYLDVAAVILLVLDRDGRIQLINAKGSSILGYRADELIGKSWFEVSLPPDERVLVRDIFMKAMAGTITMPSNYENPIVTRRGETRVIQWHNSVLCDEQGALTGSVSSGLDVTEPKLVQEALVESEARHRQMFDHAPIGIYRTTPDGRIIMGNKTMVHMLGYESFADLSAIDLTREGYAADTPRSLFVGQIEQEGEVSGFEASWLRKDGSVLCMRESARAIRDPDGNTLFYEGTIEDITEERRVQKELAYRLDLEKLLTGTAARFMSLAPDELHPGIREALRELGTFMQVDRSYIYQRSHDQLHMVVTHEWTGKSVSRKREELPVFEMAHFAWSMNYLGRKMAVNVGTLDMLPDDAEAERQEFISEEIQSLVLVPLICNDKLVGLLGFDAIWNQRHWDDDSVRLLKVVGDIFSSALERNRIEEELHYQVDFHELITTMSARLANCAGCDVDGIIDESLKALGEFAGGEACFLGTFMRKDARAQLSHVWRAEDLNPDQGEISELPLRQFRWGFRKLRRLESIQVSAISSLPEEAVGLRTFMEERGIRSLTCVPFLWGSQDLAFLGFFSDREEQSWPDDIIVLLRIAGEIMGGALERRGTGTPAGHEG